MIQSEVLTPKEAAEFLRCSLSFVHKATRAGRIPHHRLGRDLRYVKTELLHWLTNSQDTQPEQPSTPRQKRYPGPRKHATKRASRKQRALEALQSENTIAAAAQAAGVSTVTVRNWRKRDPEFDALMQAALND